MTLEIQKNDDEKTKEKYPYRALFTKKNYKNNLWMFNENTAIGIIIEKYEEFLLDVADKEDKEIGDI